MKTKTSGTEAAFENPLMPHARLRQIYLAMMQARTLARLLPRRRGDRRTQGLEALLVSPTIDLGPGDLVSDVSAGGVIDYLRGATLSAVTNPAALSKKRGMLADCGSACRLPGPDDLAERIWSALGAAAALKALTPNTAAASTTAPAPAMGVVVLYLLPDENSPALFRRTMTYAHQKSLPVLFIVLPSPTPVDGGGASSLSSIAHRCAVPAISVDCDDAVAIYRVAQESIGHARIGGGPALIEAVPFSVAGGKRTAFSDPVAGMEKYILQRGAVKRSWIDQQTYLFSKQAAAAKAASK